MSILDAIALVALIVLFLTTVVVFIRAISVMTYIVTDEYNGKLAGLAILYLMGSVVMVWILGNVWGYLFGR